MATYTLEQLTTMRDQAVTLLASVMSNPKPSYQKADQRVNWTEYIKELREQITWYNEQIEYAEPITIGETVEGN